MNPALSYDSGVRALVETPAGEILGEFVIDGYMPTTGDVIVVREGPERRYRVTERGVRLARLPTVTVAFIIVEAD
jgi:hypothetical protein